jgi:hypothetical protein
VKLKVSVSEMTRLATSPGSTSEVNANKPVLWYAAQSLDGESVGEVKHLAVEGSSRGKCGFRFQPDEGQASAHAYGVSR